MLPYPFCLCGVCTSYPIYWKLQQHHWAFFEQGIRLFCDEECEHWERQTDEWRATFGEYERFVATKNPDALKRYMGMLPTVRAPAGALNKDEIREQVSIARVLAHYGHPIPAGQGRGTIHCPLHDDRSKSFSYDTKKDLWHCFAMCGGGDIFAFIMKQEGVSFTIAMRIANTLR